MRSRIIYYTMSCVLLVMLMACKEEMHTSFYENSHIPSQITNPQVENLPGAAIISYSLPSDKELLYVKAVYEIRPGVTRETRATYYTSNLVVDGFGIEADYDVKLYSVGRNEKISDPVNVTVHPYKSSIYEVFESLNLKEDWGGLSFKFNNENEAEVVFEVILKDSLDNWISVENFYTKRMDAELAVRGLEPKEYTVGISIRDRWFNRTDTLVAQLTPLEEVEFDKTDFEWIQLASDMLDNYPNYTLPHIWDDQYWITPDWVSTPGYGLPISITFDIGHKVIISRIKVFGRIDNKFIYNSGAIKKWEIWGSIDPNPDGSWDESWQLIKECQSVKPSGLPAGQFTSEDYEYMTAGEEFTFEEAVETRYLRWKILENWGGVGHGNISEIEIYGQVID